MVNLKVLIDEDIFVQLGKQLEAEKAGHELDCYFSSEDFLAASIKYNRDVAIYFNHVASSSIIEIKNQGFKNFYPITELHWS